MLAQHFYCTERLLRPGDVLYIPRGTPHFAETDADHVAMHATLALAHVGAAVTDLLDGACATGDGSNTTLAPGCVHWRRWRDSDALLRPTKEVASLFSLAADVRVGTEAPFSHGHEDIDGSIVRLLASQFQDAAVKGTNAPGQSGSQALVHLVNDARVGSMRCWFAL